MQVDQATAAVALEEVSKSFGSVCAVNSISATIPRGTIYGFLGPNGAGKTTALRMIMSIIYPDRGSIRVLGEGLGRKSQERIGYLPEERGLYRKMTVRNTLVYLGRLKGMSRAELDREIPVWLERLELSDYARHHVEELSKGMQQKLQFASTLLHKPDLVILDEPFSGLDPVNLDMFKDVMLRMRQEGRTVIFSTHMMEQAEELCDAILLINKGRKVLDGAVEEVLQSYQTNVVVLEAAGETGFIDELPFVSHVTRSGKRLEVQLRDDASSQQLLQALAGKVHIRLFEEKRPSLHEIFVRLVRSSNV